VSVSRQGESTTVTITSTGRVILEARGIVKHFRKVVALDDVSFGIRRGTINALIGPNGAGKTTMLNVISGSLRGDQGHVHFDDGDVTGLPPHKIAGLGMARTFQLVRLFSAHGATVLDNVMMGAHLSVRPSVLKAIFLRHRMSGKEREAQAAAHEMLTFVGLKGVDELPPSSLSFGKQRMLELARALMTGPRLLLLDEPASGLNESEVERFVELLRSIRNKGVTILLVEHNMKLVMEVADDIVVLDFGHKIAEGPPSQIVNDPLVIKAYLGQDYTNERVPRC
jgi:branched-chain amino acid transport system ATP-binding protein